MTTTEFLSRLPIIAHANSGGVDLIHTRKSLPENLAPGHMGAARHELVTDMLLANDMEARFTLPHAGEVGVFATRSYESLERLLQNHLINERMIDG